MGLLVPPKQEYIKIKKGSVTKEGFEYYSFLDKKHRTDTADEDLAQKPTRKAQIALKINTTDDDQLLKLAYASIKNLEVPKMEIVKIKPYEHAINDI